MEILKQDILSEGNYYEGDLLTAVLSSAKKYGLSEKENHKTVCQIFQDNEQEFKDFDTTWEIKRTGLKLLGNLKLTNSKWCKHLC